MVANGLAVCGRYFLRINNQKIIIKMKPEELYKKEFGNAESVPKESVIRLLNHFAIVLKTERQAVKNNAVLPLVSNRFSAYDMAEWLHDNYEEVAKDEGWQTQDKCKVKFKDLPEKNKSTMIKVCERWLNGC